VQRHRKHSKALTAFQNGGQKIWKAVRKKLNDIFTVHFGQTFVTLKIVESIPGKKIVWYVTSCNKHWLKNKKEWKDTQVIWEISTKNKATQVDFTHLGLVPDFECYDACENAWTDYLHNSLLSLMTSGKGQPDPKEGKKKAKRK
jgi:hypothetical protein